MNKNKFILGILMAVLVAVCCTFYNNIPSVFATEVSEEAVEIYVPGTFTGEGTYSAGDTVRLKAEPKWDCDFLYWTEVDSNGNQVGVALSEDEEYTFEADQNIVISKDGDVFIINNSAGNEIQRIKAKWMRVGEFLGEGWYLEGAKAELRAEMNPGYNFKSWVKIVGGVETELSTMANYEIDVNEDMIIRATWERKTYNIAFTDVTSDFECDVENKINNFGNNYYGEQIEITVKVNEAISDLYIYDLATNNILINDKNIAEIMLGENLMNVQCEIDNERLDVNDKKIGFETLTIRFNIQDNIDVNIDYTYMYKLEIKSGNHIAIDNLKSIEIDEDGNEIDKHFESVLNNEYDGNTSVYYEQLDAYTYLVKDGQNITINTSNGNEIYQFLGANFNGKMQGSVGFDEKDVVKTNNNEYNKIINSHSTFVMYYEKIDYTISFVNYIKNLNGEYQPIDDGTQLYNIAEIKRQAGDELEIVYDRETKKVNLIYTTASYVWDGTGYTSDVVTDTVENEYPDIYGYKFMGFMYNGNFLTWEGTADMRTYNYEMSSTKPTNTEMQIVFEYIKYNTRIELVDKFFEDGVGYSYIAYKEGNVVAENNIVAGTEIVYGANTTKYSIKGWTNKEKPEEGDYLFADYGSTDSYSTYTIEKFVPTSDDNTTTYIIYLDVEYRYSSVQFNLNEKNIENNIDYDKVVVDVTTNTITFVNTKPEDVEGGEIEEPTEYSYEFVVKQEDINNISNSAQTYTLNVYSKSIYDADGSYSSSFGSTETKIDGEGTETTVYTEIFKDVVITGIPVNTTTIKMLDGAKVEEINDSSTSTDAVAISYSRNEVTYSSISENKELEGLAITRIITNTYTSDYTKQYVKCEETEVGALKVVEDEAELGENEIKLGEVGVEGIVVGDFVVLADVKTGETNNGTTTTYKLGGTAEYVLDKYIYYGYLQAGVIEGAMVSDVVSDGTNLTATLSLYGTLFSNEQRTGLKNEKQYVKCNETEIGALKVVADDVEVGINEIKLSEVDIEGIVVGEYVLIQYTGAPIVSETISATYDTNERAYKFKLGIYIGYLGETTDGYTHIKLANVEYKFNHGIFELKRATYNTAKDVEGVVTRYDTYGITINNLLPDHLVVYSTKTTNPTYYKINIVMDASGGSLRKFDTSSGYTTSILSSGFTNVVTVSYYRLEQKIKLQITNEKAYNYANIVFTIQREGSETTEGNGDTIDAVLDDVITITVLLENISKGYKFDGFTFLNDEIVTEYVYVFTMVDKYKDQIIYLNFSPIEYIINVNYHDPDGNIITGDDFTKAHGELRIGDVSERSLSAIVNIEGSYLFKSIAEKGYYTSSAYINTKTYSIPVFRDNGTASTTTVWTLDAKNFEEAIINNADADNTIQLYIYYSIHTYKVQVYFQIGGNSSIVQYPHVHVNNNDTYLNLIKDKGDYYVEDEGFVYGSNVALELRDVMLGTKISNWKISNAIVSTEDRYAISNIQSNVKLIVQLEYINYYLQFVTEDIEGNTCSWGGAEIVNNTNGAFYIWNQQVQYNTFSNKGYVLKNQYYINVEGEKVDVASGEMFDPAKFQIETISGAQTFKIHLVLDLKTINLAFENSTLGSIDGFDGEWVTNSVTRQRNGFSEPLTSDFKFRTGDTLVMNISTAYAGIKLNEVRLGGAMSADGVEGGISIKNDEESNYKLTRDAIKAEDKVRNYTLTINFIPDLIDGLNENTIIFNCLELQVYNIRYTYNLINYKFGVVLAISIPEAGGSSGGADEELTIENISYSSARIFTLDNDTLATFNDNFKVTGFSVPGGKHTTNETSFKLNWTNVDGEVNYWEQIALACYKTNTSDFVVTLVLEPNITLSGYDVATSDVTKDVYNYITTYNGNNQGLSKFGDAGVLAPNVSLGGGAGAIGTTFIINISYNVDGRWTDVLPINAGSYPVQITASIPGVGSDEEPIKCDKTVNLVINKALLVIKTKFDAKNPLSKTYNKQNTASKTEFLANVSLMLSGAGDKGVYERDNVKIDIDTLNLIYASSDANADMNGVLYRNKSLYDVKASNVRLTGVGALNYKLTDALAPYATSFTIGMIKAKPLTIKGLTAFNKTYDGTNSVKVDASSPIYDGRLEGDVAEVLASNLKFYLEDVKVGVGRKVLVDATDAIIGTSSTNYSVTFETMTIDIHPNELIYTIAGYGTVKVVDRDGLCKIPIGSEIKAFAYEKGSEEYNSAYSRVQDEIEKDEKFKNTYTIYLLNSDGISQSIPAGLYLYLPKINKLEQAIQLVDDDTINTVETLPIDGYSVIKMEPGSGTFAILVSRTYVPLWVIILIVSLSILAVAVFAGIIIIMKHKSKNKYSAYNKI